MTQDDALDILKMGHNVYLTGAAGSGKTFLLNQYIDFLKQNNVEVGITASTGVAATHMNGMTIHSWSGLGIRDSLSDDDCHAFLKKSSLRRRIINTKVLIIDEVSMLHHFRLDLVDKVCKLFRQNELPFGGMQVILCGDFFQLPPVSRFDEAGAQFVDTSEIWKDMNLKVCYLNEQHRHNDDSLTSVLNDIRGNRVDEETLNPLRQRYNKNVEGDVVPTKLYTHNADVDAINNRELKKIEGKQELYVMDSFGNNKLSEALKKSCLAPEELFLKKGASVMFVKNNFDKGYVNGTLGTIVDFNYDRFPIVETHRGDTIIASPESWKIEEEGKVKAEIFQIPLRLAWAITVHKSQGMSLDAAEIDLSKSFVEGMGYVALSRVRSLSGLKLLGLNNIALVVNERVFELDKELKRTSLYTLEELQNISIEEKNKQQKIFLQSIVSKGKEKSQTTYEKTKELIAQKLSIKEIAKCREMTEGTIIGHLEKFTEEGEKIDLTHVKALIIPLRLEKIKAAFKKTDDMKLSPVRSILGHNFSFDEIRLARLFLD